MVWLVDLSSFHAEMLPGARSRRTCLPHRSGAQMNPLACHPLCSLLAAHHVFLSVSVFLYSTLPLCLCLCLFVFNSASLSPVVCMLSLFHTSLRCRTGGCCAGLDPQLHMHANGQQARVSSLASWAMCDMSATLFSDFIGLSSPFITQTFALRRFSSTCRCTTPKHRQSSRRVVVYAHLCLWRFVCVNAMNLWC